MHIAIENNDFEALEILLNQNLVNINDKSLFIDIEDQIETENEKTALDIAIVKNDQDIIRLFQKYYHIDGTNETISSI